MIREVKYYNLITPNPKYKLHTSNPAIPKLYFDQQFTSQLLRWDPLWQQMMTQNRHIAIKKLSDWDKIKFSSHLMFSRFQVYPLHKSLIICNRE